jgi:hypothetical protein
MAAFMVHASPVESDSVSVESDGSFTKDPVLINTVEPTHQTGLDISILVYRPWRDIVDRLTGLGYTVTEPPDAADLNQAKLQNFNLLRIKATTLPASDESQNDEIRNGVHSDGGGLVL